MAEFEAKSLEIADASQGCQPAYASENPAQHSWLVMDDSAGASRNLFRADAPSGSGNSSTSGYHYGQQNETMVSREASDAVNHGSTTFGTPAAHEYSHYAPYSSYPGYQNQYYAYQQQPANASSQQQVGPGQNTGAYHQPLSSFQNPSSYVGPTGYTGTYYNHGDYQTTAGYSTGPNGGYVNQTHVWSGTNTRPYASNDYPKYTVPSTCSAQDTNAAPEAPLSHQHQYNQWASYYSQSGTSAAHAPELESKQLTSASMGNPTPSIYGGYSYGHNQPPPPGTTSWRQDFASKLPCLQGKNEASECNQIESSVDVHQTYQANPTPSKGPNIQFSLNNQIFPNFQSHSQTVSGLDFRQTSKIQIPTNPRIAPSVSVNVVKNDKEMGAVNPTIKPAYISVSAPKTGNEVPPHDSAGSIPPSLRHYVEKTFARCKNDSQRAANQAIMKEMITKASADGTLLTRDWDTETIFALPTSDDASGKKSPSRRTKSRWEPVSEDNSEKLLPANVVPRKNAWNHYKNHVNVSRGINIAKPEVWNTAKFVPAEAKSMSPMSTPRAQKKPRHDDGNTENTDSPSDSDKEQNLTRYHSSAIALMNSPEERKKREYRVKRFEKGGEHQTEVKQLKLRDVGAANLYARRTSAFLLAKNEDNSNKAVEDIDWDSLTVKGTCQEIEKRYLRLTSAPDPATVRPEEILEKALWTVQNSQKNYLYKCDQLKSIRQDLTVQRIRNELTVKVYETHARIALEAGDLAEYNQCQSQLKTLYAEGIRGCHLEFSAYHLLCVILHSNNREVLSSMARLSVEAKRDEAVKHALAVRGAVTSENYIMFFRLYRESPNLNTCLMDLYVEKMRFAAVKCMCKSYRPTLPVAYVAQVLGFSKTVLDGNETDGLVECELWLISHGASLTSGPNGEKHLDTKVSSANLFQPEPEDAVAHGDATLAVDDFLTKGP